MSVASLISQASLRLEETGIERPVFEAQLLMAHALGVTRADVLRDLQAPVVDDQVAAFQWMITRRAGREPLAYIRGSQEFYGLDFRVTPAVLIPRPETELLVDFARELAPSAILDVGTGSGCIAIACARRLPDATVIALDQSADSLEIARENAIRLRTSVPFIRGDLLNPIRPASLDLVLSNPPYIPSSEVKELQPEVRDYEPAAALDGGPDGLAFIRAIVADSRRVLCRGGWLAMEVALGQAQSVGNLLSQSGFESVGSRKDLAGIERMVIGRNA